MKRKYINNGHIKNIKAKRLNGQYKVVDKGKAKDSVLALNSLNIFKKKPLVKMERIDIKPYLNGNNHPLLLFQDSRPTYNVNSASYHNLLKTIKLDCKVSVSKDNLTGLLDIINESRLNASMKARLKLINDEYTKFYGDTNIFSHSTPIMTNFKKQRKSVSFSDKITIHEIQEYHKCDKCSKIFDEYSKLRTHIREEHKKKNQYECNYCKKCFVDRSIFKVHIKLHCDMCGLFCKKRSAYLIHRRDVCRVIKRYHCNTCQNTFFRFMDLKDHTYEHKDSTFYICDICKEQCTNPCFLAHHIKFLHWKKRPKSLYEVRNLGCDRLYLCNFCEFTSVDKNIIENHVELLPDFSNRVMTGYKDYYFCDQCFKKFDIETDMLQHKWTHFLITNTENSLQNNLNDVSNSSLNNNKKLKKHKNRRPLIKIKALKFVTSNNQEVKLRKKLKLKLKLIKKKKRRMQQQVSMVNKTSAFTPKMFYNIHEELPLKFKPFVRLDKTVIPKYLKESDQQSTEDKIIHFVDIAALNDTLSSDNNINESLMLAEDGKPIVDKSSKKTLLSRFQCDVCLKYLSSPYCLKRHYLEVHERAFKCSSCYNVFSTKKEKLLHDCTSADVIQPNHSNIDDFNITDDYMDNVDFEIPAPIVELTEYDTYISKAVPESNFGTNNVKNNDLLLRKFLSEPMMKDVDSNFLEKASYGIASPYCGLDQSGGYAAVVNNSVSANCSKNNSNSLCNRSINVNNNSANKILNGTVKSVNNAIAYFNVSEVLPVEFISY